MSEYIHKRLNKQTNKYMHTYIYKMYVWANKYLHAYINKCINKYTKQQQQINAQTN